ncbi:MAG: hypothetical protein JWR78_2414, partial [Mycobacterium sp.]|nr:hypothetical protein [Mycobacterium sp.]
TGTSTEAGRAAAEQAAGGGTATAVVEAPTEAGEA